MNIDDALRLLPGVPLVESPFFDQIVGTSNWDEETKRVARDLHDEGYAFIDFPEPELDEIAERIKASLQGEFDWEGWRAGNVQSVWLRILDGWPFNDDIRRIAVNAKIIRLLSAVYGRTAFPFQTLNFPVGTQQHFHTDAVHFSSMPERFMCGVWVAMEDIGEDQGPLLYFPGSHKWPIYTNEHIGHRHLDVDITGQGLYEEFWRHLAEAHQAEPKTICIKKGQAFIWAANMLHGGAPQHDKSKTRWSQVTHYYFENCAYYTPMLSDPILGSIFFREPIDISTSKPVENRLGGVKIPAERIAAASKSATVSALVRDLCPDFDPAAYLAVNDDVAADGVDPFVHYWTVGRYENFRRIR
jgi:Phytanoyl-CoA dioxygenase (PhyH)